MGEVCACGTACLVCAVRRFSADHPHLAQQVDLLVNELTVALMLAETPEALRPRFSAESAEARKAARAQRDLVAWPAIEAMLRAGPVRLYEIGEAAYGQPSRLLSAGQLAHLTQALCMRLVRRGLVVRCRRGWYALPGVRRGMPAADLGACRRLLRTGRRHTVYEIMVELEASLSSVYRWLARLRQGGEPLRYDTVPGTTHPIRRWYLEGATPAIVVDRLAGVPAARVRGRAAA